VITAAIGGFSASSTVAPIPDLAFITQIAGIGALFGTLTVLRSDANRRRRRLPVDANRPLGYTRQEFNGTRKWTRAVVCGRRTVSLQPSRGPNGLREGTA
jgi:hypothetical protein